MSVAVKGARERDDANTNGGHGDAGHVQIGGEFEVFIPVAGGLAQVL